MTAARIAERHYTEFLPPEGLRPFLACYWRFWVDAAGAPPPVTHIPPDGSVNLVLMPSESGSLVMIVGPYTEPQPAEVPAGYDIVGMRFWPGAAEPLLDDRSAGLANRDQRLDDFHPGLARELAEARRDRPAVQVLLERMSDIVANLTRTWSLDPVVMKAVAAILETKGRLAIRSLVRTSGLSERQFQRRFLRATGLTAKELARVRRVRAAAIEVLERNTPFAEVADGLGFSDQAHLIREFRDLIGASPRSYRGNIRGIRHGSYDR